MAIKERRGTIGRTLGTFALGAAAGSIVALLYAPASGTVTRKRLKMKFKAVQKSALVLKDAAAQRLGSARAWVTERLTHANGNGRSRRHQPVH